METAAVLPPLPTFVILGAQKSATRWLRHNLGLHPDIFSATYEISFFDHDRRYLMGPDFYRSQFEGWAGEPYLGEGTPGYLMEGNQPERVATRMYETIPTARLFAVLRDPVDRAQSALIHHIRYERVRPSTQLVEFVRQRPPESDPLGIVAGGRYAQSLRPYFERFGDQLEVVLHDDIRDQPAVVYRRALDHVGADPDFQPDGLGDVLFSNRSDQPEGERVRGDDPIGAEARVELYGYFRDDVARLEEMLGRDLSVWDPAG